MTLPFVPDFRRFCAATADVGAEEVDLLEAAVDRVTGILMQDGSVSRTAMVALQDFDRLKQEFAALMAVVRRFDEIFSSNAVPDAAERIFADIPVAGLQARLRRRLLGTAEQDLESEVEF